MVTNFYPRPPRGGRHSTTGGSESDVLFLSTPSARRATRVPDGRAAAAYCHFYPRPPRGGRLLYPVEGDGLVAISIHALREEGDYAKQYPERHNNGFLSTPSARRATLPSLYQSFQPSISIHALREEGDRYAPNRRCLCHAFLSTPSARRATQQNDAVASRLFISIHALREEGDRQKRLRPST